MEKFCQSCAMPLITKDQDNRGTESDGQLSGTYCSLCYQHGTFTEPNLSFEQMLERGKRGIEAGDMNFLMKLFMKHSYPFLLKKVSRWK